MSQSKSQQQMSCHNQSQHRVSQSNSHNTECHSHNRECYSHIKEYHNPTVITQNVTRENVSHNRQSSSHNRECHNRECFSHNRECHNPVSQWRMSQSTVTTMSQLITAGDITKSHKREYNYHSQDKMSQSQQGVQVTKIPTFTRLQE